MIHRRSDYDEILFSSHGRFFRFRFASFNDRAIIFRSNVERVFFYLFLACFISRNTRKKQERKFHFLNFPHFQSSFFIGSVKKSSRRNFNRIRNQSIKCGADK